MQSIEVEQGEAVIAQMRWADKGGAIDLTGRTLAITDAYPAALMDGTVEVTDAENGVATLTIPGALARAMGRGRTNWIRVAMSLSGGELDATPPIWIEVR